ncbi:MAG: HIT family protein [Sulfurospirillum sp.]|nr:HIT family protein [Sulfurospirillum sp.]
MRIYENKIFYIEVEQSEIPWLKIFTCKPYRELSECDEQTRVAILEAMLTIEQEMLQYYKPTKINIALFGNYLPRVHIHIMARFENDSYFPEPMWGKKQREGQLNLPPLDDFIRKVQDIFVKNEQ